jgi:hypothetical protein
VGLSESALPASAKATAGGSDGGRTSAEPADEALQPKLWPRLSKGGDGPTRDSANAEPPALLLSVEPLTENTPEQGGKASESRSTGAGARPGW